MNVLLQAITFVTGLVGSTRFGVSVRRYGLRCAWKLHIIPERVQAAQEDS